MTKEQSTSGSIQGLKRASKVIKNVLNKEPKIYDLLKSDHRKVEGLFAQIDALGERAEGRFRELVEELDRELSAHAEAEEKAFYSKIKNTNKAQEITLEAFEEHNVIKGLLHEISTSRKALPVLKAKCTVLKEIVAHHVREEESEIFSKAKSLLDTEEEVQIAKKFQSLKEKILSTELQ